MSSQDLSELRSATPYTALVHLCKGVKGAEGAIVPLCTLLLKLPEEHLGASLKEQEDLFEAFASAAIGKALQHPEIIKAVTIRFRELAERASPSAPLGSVRGPPRSRN